MRNASIGRRLVGLHGLAAMALVLGTASPAAALEAVLFENTGFGGRSLTLDNNRGNLHDECRVCCDFLGGCEGDWGDNLSSIRVQEGTQVTLYENANFEGHSCVLTADDGNLHELPCQLGDEVSSIKIEAVAPPAGPAGPSHEDIVNEIRAVGGNVTGVGLAVGGVRGDVAGVSSDVGGVRGEVNAIRGELGDVMFAVGDQGSATRNLVRNEGGATRSLVTGESTAIQSLTRFENSSTRNLVTSESAAIQSQARFEHSATRNDITSRILVHEAAMDALVRNQVANLDALVRNQVASLDALVRNQVASLMARLGVHDSDVRAALASHDANVTGILAAHERNQAEFEARISRGLAAHEGARAQHEQRNSDELAAHEAARAQHEQHVIDELAAHEAARARHEQHVIDVLAAHEAARMRHEQHINDDLEAHEAARAAHEARISRELAVHDFDIKDLLTRVRNTLFDVAAITPGAGTPTLAMPNCSSVDVHGVLDQVRGKLVTSLCALMDLGERNLGGARNKLAQGDLQLFDVGVYLTPGLPELCLPGAPQPEIPCPSVPGVSPLPRRGSYRQAALKYLEGLKDLSAR